MELGTQQAIRKNEEKAIHVKGCYHQGKKR